MAGMAGSVATAARRRGTRSRKVIDWKKFWEWDDYRNYVLLPVAGSGLAPFAGKVATPVQQATAAMDRMFTWTCSNAKFPPNLVDSQADACAEVSIALAGFLFEADVVQKALRKLKPRWQQWYRRR